MKKALIFLADGFEEIEAVTVIDVLRRGNVDVKIVSVANKLEVTGAHGVELYADEAFDQKRCDEADMLILPGGSVGAKALEKHKGVTGAIIKAFHENKYIAAICAAPSILGLAGVLDGKTAVCYPGYELKLVGAAIGKQNVVVDGRIVTSKGPGTAGEFAFKLLEILQGVAVYTEVKKGMLL